ncbi:V-set and immunoglobulin domain-containing protein 1-like [Rhinoraja longicauda]
MSTLKLQLLVTLIAFSGCVRAVQVTVKDGHVNGTEGGSVTLLCTYTTSDSDSSNMNIQWAFVPSHSKSQMQIYFFGGNVTFINPAFKGRLLAGHKPGNASITIEKLRPTDSGNYICEVENPPDFKGNNIGTATLTVLVPPSKPHCGIAAHPSKARSAILTCHCDKGVPSPRYRWVKLVDQVHQNISGHLDPRTGMLTISNISDTENGIYQCIAFNTLGHETCTVDLSKLSSESDSIIGGVIGAVLIASVIGVIIWMVTKKAKKNAKKNAQKDTELQAKQESNKTLATYVAVPTDAAAVESTNHVESPDVGQNSTDTPDLHQPPHEHLPLSEHAAPSGSGQAEHKESEGDGPHEA